MRDCQLHYIGTDGEEMVGELIFNPSLVQDTDGSDNFVGAARWVRFIKEE